MKRNFAYSRTLWLVLLLVVGLHTVLNAQTQPYALGSSSDLLNGFKQQNARSAGVELRVSGTQAFAGKVNYASNDGKYLVGEVAGEPASSFYISVNKKTVTGHIILKKANLAYSYYSDEQGNAFVKPVEVSSLICIEYEEAPAGENVTAKTEAVQALPNLQSFPGANGCILLDFDGQYVAGTPWNNGNPINAASSGMSDAAIQEHWEIVAEDFRPLNVNVTTNEGVFNSYPKNRRMRVIITPTNTAAPGAGGVAYMNSFNWNDDTPCWVFITSGKAGGEASSHEVGHTLGLGHDGRNSPAEGYFAGHGDWSPIMGVGYYKPITQWSKGEYNSANNKQDDMATMASSTFGLGFRGDEAGNGTGNAKALNIDGSGNVPAGSNYGVITNEADWDFYSFSTRGGTITINCNTVSRHGDLDIILRLYNSSGAQIGTHNPGGLNANGYTVNLGAGTYYLSVDGTGAGNPATDGYSAYASLGSYWISGNIPTATTTGTVVVYKDCNFGGTAVGLGVGSYNVGDLQARGILNDDVSSLKVQSGYEAILYWDGNYSGQTLTVRGDNSCLVNNGWNDQVSSMVIRAIPSSFNKLIEAESYSAMAGVQTEPCNEGGSNVGYIEVNDWMAYNSINFPTSGNYKIEYRVASLSGGGRLSADLNAGSIVLGALNVPSTGGWQNWTTISHTVHVNAGTYNFGVFAVAGGWNINWIRITKTTARTSQSSTVDLADVDMTEETIELFPNPADADLNIVTASGVNGLQYTVVDAMGSTVMSGVLGSEMVSVSNLHAGIYTLVVYKEDGTKLSKRFVKQ